MIFQMGSTFFFQKVNSVILMNAIPKKASKVLQALERILTRLQNPIQQPKAY